MATRTICSWFLHLKVDKNNKDKYVYKINLVSVPVSQALKLQDFLKETTHA